MLETVKGREEFMVFEVWPDIQKDALSFHSTQSRDRYIHWYPLAISPTASTSSNLNLSSKTNMCLYSKKIFHSICKVDHNFSDFFYTGIGFSIMVSVLKSTCLWNYCFRNHLYVISHLCSCIKWQIAYLKIRTQENLWIGNGYKSCAPVNVMSGWNTNQSY